jgi:CRP-like cAMP-binding protein
MNPAELFSHETNPVRLSPDQILFKAGEPGDAMYVVLEGALDIVLDGRVLETSTRGHIIGEMALIDQSPRSATVIAREPSALVRLDSPRFHRLIQQNPFFATHIMKVLAERLRRADQHWALDEPAS